MNRLLRLIFPPRCAFCGGFLHEGENEICAQCMGKLRFLPDGQVKAPLYVENCVAALRYEKEVRTAVHRLKFRGRQSAAVPMGRLLAHQVRSQMDESFDFVTWVPTGTRNLRRRGYDHARLIAEETAAHLGLEARPTLRRVRDTEPMFGLDPAERQANVFDAFAVLPDTPVGSARILLVDDVLTTGATLSECARALCEGGAEKVFGAAFAMAKKSK